MNPLLLGAAVFPACPRDMGCVRVPRKRTVSPHFRRPAVTASPESADESPVRGRRRFGRSLPVIAGSVIAAAGLAVGVLGGADATTGHQPPSVDQQAARGQADDTPTP